ncbi:MAG: DUF2147 domain-containing protein [Prevotellaceae bacterium]|nr:DUF2147 domain-containing protein [Prevotellaceae bacterium]
MGFMRGAALAVLLLAVCAGFCFAADPAEGYWISVDDKGKKRSGWELYLLNGNLCGKMVSAPATPHNARASKCRESYQGFPIPGKVNEMMIVGTPWIFGLTMERPGHWTNGSVINPENGKIYKCKMTFHPADGKRYPTDVLEMRGEIGLGIGRSQFWQKSTAEEVNALH